MGTSTNPRSAGDGASPRRTLGSWLATSAIDPLQLALLEVFFAALAAMALYWAANLAGLAFACVCLGMQYVFAQLGRAGAPATPPLVSYLQLLATMVVLIGLGYAASLPLAGWLAALASVAACWPPAGTSAASRYRRPVLAGVAMACALAAAERAWPGSFWLPRVAVLVAAAVWLAAAVQRAALWRHARG